MYRWMFSMLAVAGALLSSAAAPAAAADSPIEAIPDTAVVAIRIREPEALTESIGKLVARVDAEFGRQFNRQAPLAKGMIISNPSLAGVDRRRDWWVAVFLREEGDPATVFGVATTDRDQMKEALGNGQFKFVDYENWVLYSEDEAAIAEIRARTAGRGKSLASAIDPKAKELMDSADASLLINVQGITSHYQVELDAAVAEIEQTLEQLPELAPEVEGVNLEPVFRMYGEFFRSLVQGVKDSRSVTVGVSVQSRGVLIEERLSVAADSPTAELFHHNPPRELSILRQLPPKQLVYMAASADMQGLMGWAGRLTGAMAPDEEKRKQISEYFESLSQMKFGVTASSFSLSTKPGEGAFRTIQLIEMDEPTKMRDLTRRMPEAVAAGLGASQAGAGVKQEMTLKEDAETYGSHKGDLMTVTQEFNDEADPLGVARGITDAMFGPGGIQSRIVYLDKLVVQTTGGGRPGMLTALRYAEGRSTLDRESAPEIDATSRRLLKEANLAVLFDLPTLVADLLKLASQSGQLPLPIDTQEVSRAKGAASWIGFTMATEEAGLRAKTWVPVEQIKSFVGLGKLFQGMLGGLGGPGGPGGPGEPGAPPRQF